MLKEIEKKFYRLAESFPTVREALAPLDSLRSIEPVLCVIAELKRSIHGDGKSGAAKFLSFVWCGDVEEFEFRRAWSHWDQEHRDAWKEWARDPWWA